MKYEIGVMKYEILNRACKKMFKYLILCML